MHVAVSNCFTTLVVLPGVATIATLIGSECVNEPYVPEELKENIVGVTDGPAVTVRVLGEVEPSLGGVTGLGDTELDTPDGAPATAKLSAELKPPRELIVTCVEPDPPTGIVIVAGTAEIEKSPTFSMTDVDVLPVKLISPAYVAVIVREP
jgi:hypothetical protein